jgi:hypothetical protein
MNKWICVSVLSRGYECLQWNRHPQLVRGLVFNSVQQGSSSPIYPLYCCYAWLWPKLQAGTCRVCEE